MVGLSRHRVCGCTVWPLPQKAGTQPRTGPYTLGPVSGSLRRCFVPLYFCELTLRFHASLLHVDNLTLWGKLSIKFETKIGHSEQIKTFKSVKERLPMTYCVKTHQEHPYLSLDFREPKTQKQSPSGEAVPAPPQLPSELPRVPGPVIHCTELAPVPTVHTAQSQALRMPAPRRAFRVSAFEVLQMFFTVYTCEVRLLGGRHESPLLAILLSSS